MKATRRHLLVFVTAPDLGVARLLAREVVGARAAVCANIIPGVESLYWWQDRMETAAEHLVIFKTDRKTLAHLEQIVRAHHPYTTPEVVAFPLVAGAREYLEWLDAGLSRQHAVTPSPAA